MRIDPALHRLAIALVVHAMVLGLAFPASGGPWNGVWEVGFEKRIASSSYPDKSQTTDDHPWAATGAIGLLRDVGSGWSLGPVSRISLADNAGSLGVGLRVMRRLTDAWSVAAAPGVLLARGAAREDVDRFYFVAARVSFREVFALEYREDVLRYRPRSAADGRPTLPLARQTERHRYLGINTGTAPAGVLIAGGVFALVVFEAVELLRGE